MGTSPEREAGEGVELRLEAIHAGYRRTVLRGLDLTVGAGVITAILGPNGVGKSSIFKVAAGLLRPESGRVWVGGEDVTWRAPHQRVARGLAFAMQGGRVFPSLTVEQNLTLGLRGVSARERESRLEEVGDLFPALQARRGVRAGLLSGGVRQALALASKLVGRPRLLLLDEPTVGLSQPLARELFEHLGRVNRERGTTVLIIERDTSEALALAHRAVLIRDGRVAASTERPAEWRATGDSAETAGRGGPQRFASY